MGIHERKEREKEEMRRKILVAARDLFREQGFRATSIRNIADAIEYSPATIYLYYKDKNAILYALQYEAAETKRDHLLPAAAIADPWERLLDIGRRYIDFALRYPDWYELLFIMRAPMEAIENEACWQLGMTSHQFLTDTVRACMEEGYFPGQDAETVAFTLWCHVHGMMAIYVSDRMKMYPEEKRPELIQKSLEMIAEMGKQTRKPG